MIIQNFRDRERELAELKEAVENERFELIIIYGRRRIGKTELALKATESKKRVYYLAVGEKNIERFQYSCSRLYPEVSKLKADWETIFEFLKDRADVVILDEFQNMIKEDGKVLNIFQSITDTILKGSKLKLFLLGSSVSIMTSRVLEHKSPLYGRRTGSLELKAMRFSDISKFYPKYGIKELMEIYGFADGIPFYLVKIDRRFWSWLQGEVRKQRGFLKDEVDFLMKYEFDDPGTYKLILEAIANGKAKLNEIKDFIKVKRTDISPYLSNLLGVKMIKREVPITENIKSRMGRYRLSDNFLRFWFRYIYPNLSSIEEGMFDVGTIKPDYNRYLGHVFEDVCRQFLVRENKEFSFTKIGRWWHRDMEIDIIALNEQTKDTMFAECKWKDRVDAKRVLSGLKDKAGHVQWNNGKRNEHYAIFAKSFRDRNVEGVKMYDLKDMERVFRMPLSSVRARTGSLEKG